MRWTLTCIYVMASLNSQEQVHEILFVFFYCEVFLVCERTTLLLEYMGKILSQCLWELQWSLLEYSWGWSRHTRPGWAGSIITLLTGCHHCPAKKLWHMCLWLETEWNEQPWGIWKVSVSITGIFPRRGQAATMCKLEAHRAETPIRQGQPIRGWQAVVTWGMWAG